MSRFLAAITILSLAAAMAHADDAADIPANARVRVAMDDGATLKGRLSAADSAILMVRTEDGIVQSLPRASVTKLEFRQDGPRNRAKGALIGAAIGVAVGLAIGIPLATDDDPFLDPDEKSRLPLVFGGLFGGIGAGVGAAIGTSGSRWLQAHPAQVKVTLLSLRF